MGKSCKVTLKTTGDIGTRTTDSFQRDVKNIKQKRFISSIFALGYMDLLNLIGPGLR